MRAIGTLDIETDPFQKRVFVAPFAADFFDGKTHFLFWGQDAVERCVKAALTFDGVIYAHNGGKFDFHFILRILVDVYGAENLEILTIGSRIVRIKTPGPEFRDSYAIIPKPLSSFGNKVDIKDASKPDDPLWKFRKQHREKYRTEICDYLKQDCAGLHDAVLKFVSQFGSDLTLASTTFRILRKEYGFKIPKSNRWTDKKFRRWYFAGRVQFFQLGEVPGRTICVDINSAFPWAMTFPHWYGLECLVRTRPPIKNREQAFYDVVCDADGCFPFRNEDNSVSFPHTTATRFHVTGWELFTALELGLCRNVQYRAVYAPKDCRDFSQFVNHFYRLKQIATDPAERQFAKLILNSCYGKFALNPLVFRTVKVVEYDTVLDDPWQHCYDDLDSGLSFWKKPSHEPDGENDKAAKRPLRFNNVSTAASITGCVRAFLMRSMHACKGVVYCDTDSIIARDVSALKLGDGLGEWKHEKTFDGFWIGGKKLYAGRGENGEWKTASKGVRLSPEQIVKVALGESQTYEFDAPNYSPFSAPGFTKRTVNRDDKRKRKKRNATK